MDLYVTAQSTGLSDSSPLIRFTWMWSLSYVLCYSVSYRKSSSLFLSASDLVKCLLRVSFVLAWPVGCTSARSLKVSVDLQMRRSYLSFESVLLDVVYLFSFFQFCLLCLHSVSILPCCLPVTPTLSLSLSLCEANFCVFPPFLSHLHAFTRFWHKLHLVLCGVQTIVSVELCSSPLSHLFPFTRFLWRAAAVLMSRAVQVKLVTLGSVRGHLWIMMMRVHVKVWRQVNTASIPGCHTVSSWKRAPLVSLNTWIPQSANHVYIDLFCTLFVPFIFGQHEKWDFKP